MIDRFTSDACKDAIIEMSIEDDRLPSFRDFEWKILRLICKILKPLKDATLMAQKRTTSVSSIIPTLKIIEMDLISNPQVKQFLQVREAIVNGLKNRLGGICSFYFSAPILFILVLPFSTRKFVHFLYV